MSKKPGPTVTTSSVDDNTKQQMQQIWDAAGRAGTSGPGPLLTGASGYNTGLMDAGTLGTRAMSGDPAAVSQLMNPYQQQVIDANNAQWQKTNLQTANQVNDAAAKAGAFGGSRHGVAEGTALATNNMNQQAQTAGLLDQGFGQTMDRAGQMAQMGFAGAGANSQLGFQGVGNPDLWRMQMMKQGFMGPTGQTSSTTPGAPGSSFLNGALGGATVGSAFGPWGAAIGAGAGGLLSIF